MGIYYIVCSNVALLLLLVLPGVTYLNIHNDIIYNFTVIERGSVTRKLACGLLYPPLVINTITCSFFVFEPICPTFQELWGVLLITVAALAFVILEIEKDQ